SSAFAVTIMILPSFSISTRLTAMPALTVALRALVTSRCLNVCWPRDIASHFPARHQPRTLAGRSRARTQPHTLAHPLASSLGQAPIQYLAHHPRHLARSDHQDRLWSGARWRLLLALVRWSAPIQYSAHRRKFQTGDGSRQVTQT